MRWLNLLNAFSGVWAFAWENVMVLFLCEPRYPRRKTWLLCLAVSIAVVIPSLQVYGAFGSNVGSQLSLAMRVLPMLAFFFVTSAHRDARPVFTYLFVECVTYECIYLTNILNTYLTPETYYINFFGRLLCYPLMAWWVWQRVRQPYQTLLHAGLSGWGRAAVLAAMAYVTQNLMFHYPVSITERPAELPAMLLLMALTPLMFWQLLNALLRQRELHDARDRERLLDMQTKALQRRVEQSELAEKRLSVQRHDLRHRLQTLRVLLERGETSDALAYLDASTDALAQTKQRVWCENPVLDSVFSASFALAEAEGVRIEASLDIPKDLEVSAAELSTVFANALENARHAVSALPPELRVIRCKCIRRPQLMFSVSNPYEGEVRFNDLGQPVATEEGHGLGTASIAAYCEKHGAFCEYETKDGWFTLRMVQP